MFLKSFGILLTSLFIGQYAYQKLYLGTEVLLGYSAKNICSNYFTSGFNRSQAVGLEAAAIPHLTTVVDVSIDDQEQSVSCNAFGYTRKAFYHGRYGCILAPTQTLSMELGNQLENLNQKIQTIEKSLPEEIHTRTVKSGDFQNYLIPSVQRIVQRPEKQLDTLNLQILDTRSNQIIGRFYKSGIPQDTPLCGWSMTKSLFGALIYPTAMEQLSPMKISKNLLQMIDDLSYTETYGLWGEASNMQFGKKSLHQFVEGIYERKKGNRWHYSSLDTNLLSLELERAFNDSNRYLSYPFQLLHQYGINSLKFEVDQDGTLMASSAGYLKPHDWLRLGTVFMSPSYQNQTRLYQEITKPENLQSNGIFSGHLWRATNLSKSKCESGEFPDNYQDICSLVKHLPEGSFWARGLYGQYLIMIPSLDFVILRLARDVKVENWGLSSQFKDIVKKLHRLRDRPWTQVSEPTLQVHYYWGQFLTTFWWPPVLWVFVILLTTHLQKKCRSDPIFYCNVFAFLAFSLNLIRVFYFCLLTEAEAIFDQNSVWCGLLGFGIFVLGQVLNFMCYYRLGYHGIYYGVCFGIPTTWCTRFPYDKFRDPQYLGSSLSCLGYTIARGRVVGYSGIACGFIYLSYWIVGRLENYLIPICLEEAHNSTSGKKAK